MSSKQLAFLLVNEREALFGGAAGGGKSEALLQGATQYVDDHSTASLLLRRTYRVKAGETIATRSSVAVAEAKRVIQEGQGADLRVAHALEQEAFGLVSASQDRAEGMDAFLEKRDPKFPGR